MKKKIAIVVASTMMLFGSGAAAYAKEIPWGLLWELAKELFSGSDSSIPCWSAGSTNGENRYVDCSSCMSVQGSPNNGSGSCTPR